MVNKKEILKSNPVAKELRTVKFRSQKIKNKKNQVKQDSNLQRTR